MPPKGNQARSNGRSRVPVDFRMSATTPKPQPAETSWWVDCDDAEFTRRARKVAERTAQTSSEHFDRSRR